VVVVSISRRLFAPVDIASLVVFRVCFGLLLAWEVGCYFRHDWIDQQLIRPAMHFSYFGFDWVEPLPGQAMYAFAAALGVLALMVAAGAFYRAATAAFAVGFTYLFLIDQAYYLNHFYLVCLVSLLMIFLPASRAFSVDAWLRPRSAASVIPAWPVWLLRAQLAIVYFYAGVAKLNVDWLRGAPMDMWLAKRAQRPLLGPWLTLDWMPYFFSYGGLLLDLFVVPFLLWRRTRVWAFTLTLLFHLSNSWMFSIGIFPWFMIAATTLFFEPDWPRRVGRRLASMGRRVAGRAGRAAVVEPGGLAGTQDPRISPLPQPAMARLTVSAVAIYLLVQLVVPLRHHLYPGCVHWTEEGHRFAWHMKLRSKTAVEASFNVRYTDRDGGRAHWEVKPGQYLRPWQADKMVVRPDMVLQFSHFLVEDMRRAGFEDVEVRANIRASLNGREPQILVDPDVDLAAERRSLAAAPWIVPLSAGVETASR